MKLLPPAILLLCTASVGHADNLRVDVNCADFWATPDSGLDVRVDGVPAAGGHENDSLAVGITKHGNEYLTLVPTDIGFSIAPGTHRVTIGAPGCAPLDTQVSVGPIMPAFVSGRLPVSDASLAGPAGAPNGLGIMLGGYSTWRGAHTETDGVGDTTYAWDPIQTTGGVLSMSYEHRRFALAYDMMLGTASGTGTSTNTAFGTTGSPNAFNANVLELANQLRIGYRVPENTVAFAAGTGLGGGVNIVTSGLVGGGGGFDFFVPVWASMTYKPSCDWGAQLIGSYDVHPTSMTENAPSLIVGVQWQPTAACSEQPGLAVR